jgi:hypothetical protein
MECSNRYLNHCDSTVVSGSDSYSVSNDSITMCPNAVLCGNKSAEWYLNDHDATCGECSEAFAGPLNIEVTDAECFVCLQPSVHEIQLKQCSHRVCLSCFKRLHGIGEDSYSWENEKNLLSKCPICRRRCPESWNLFDS